MALVTLIKDQFVGGAFYPAGSQIDSSLVPGSPGLSTSQAGMSQIGNDLQLNELVIALGGVGVGGATGGLGKLSAGITRVRNRTGRARIGIIGDSLWAGAGAGQPVGYGTGAAIQPPNALRSMSQASQLAALLNAAGIPARADNWSGSGNIASYTTPIADTQTYYGGQISLPAGAVLSSGPYLYGGQRLTMPATASAPMTYAPLAAADTFDVWYLNLVVAQFTISDASGTLATVNTTATNTIGKVTVPRAAASKLPISLQWVSGLNFYPINIEAYNTAAPVLEIINLSGSGLTAAGWALAGNAAAPITGVPQMAFDGHIIALGANDQVQSLVSTFQANLQAFATACKTSGDVIIVKPNKPQTLGGNYDVGAAGMLPMYDSVAAAVGAVATIDLYNGTTLTAPGDYFIAGDIHPSAQGVAKLATLNTSTIMAKV